MTLVAAFVLQGCASVPGPIQISPDTYLITREDHRGIFGSLASLKAEVINEANQFAARQGKVAIPISSQEKPLGRGPAQWVSFEYRSASLTRTILQCSAQLFCREPTSLSRRTRGV